MTTNYERIKNMTVEEMAEWLCREVYECEFCPYLNDVHCSDKFEQYLKAESEE